MDPLANPVARLPPRRADRDDARDSGHRSVRTGRAGRAHHRAATRRTPALIKAESLTLADRRWFRSAAVQIARIANLAYNQQPWHRREEAAVHNRDEQRRFI